MLTRNLFNKVIYKGIIGAITGIVAGLILGLLIWSLTEAVSFFHTILEKMPSQSYTLFEIPIPRQKFVHVHSDANELGRVYHANLAINATPQAF